MTNNLRSAWAVLGLSPGSSFDAARSAYRTLAKRWHPDRFLSDPAGQAEASIQMRIVNDAYRRIVEAAGPSGTTEARAPPEAPTGRRLSREEVDRFTASIGRESFVDSLLDSLPSSALMTFRRTEDQWTLTPTVVSLLFFGGGMVVIGMFEWSGNPLSGWSAKIAALVVVVGSLLAPYALQRRRGW